MRFNTSWFSILFLLAISFVGCGPKSTAVSESTPTTAKVLQDGLKVRLSPNTMASIVGSVSLGETVAIKERSPEKSNVGSLSAHWFQIETQTGLNGWVYGAYLDAEAPPEILLASKNNEKIAQMVTGRWYATRQDGTLTRAFLTLYDDNTLEAGNDRTVTYKGTYTVEITGDKAVIVPVHEKPDSTAIPPFTDIRAEVRGETLYFTAIWREATVRLEIAEKNPQPFEP